MESVIRYVEAILFASSSRLKVEEIAKYLPGTKIKKIKSALGELKKYYDNTETSIILLEESETWKLSLKTKYLPLVEKLMPRTDLSKPVVETLAILAWKAPMLQSELVHMRSAIVYDHLVELDNIGLVSKVKHGRSFILKLTERFYDYFDVPKEAVAELVGDFEEPTIPEVNETELETEDERKDRLMKEISENKINPEKIINKDKEYLKSFDKKLEKINKDMSKVELNSEDVEKARELVGDIKFDENESFESINDELKQLSEKIEDNESQGNEVSDTQEQKVHSTTEIVEKNKNEE